MADKSVNQFLLDSYIERGVRITRIESGLQNEVLLILRDLADELSAILSKANWDSGSVDQKLARLEKLSAQAQSAIEDHYSVIDKRVDENARSLVLAESEWIGSVVNTYLGVELFDVSLNRNLLKSLTSDVMIQGAPSAAWWYKQEQTTMFNFMKEMRLGILQGEDLNELIRRVRGRRENRFTDGVISASTREAEALVRTSAQTVLNDVRMEIFRQNKEVVQGVQWVTALDYKVCPQCRPRDKATWDLEGNPINEIAKGFFFRRPPIHYNDRCALVPVLYSWEELAKKYGGNTRIGKIIDQMSKGTRSSMDGQVPETMTFEEWLKMKDSLEPAEVEKLLTPKRYEQWKKGKLPLGSFLDDRGNYLTISELNL